jgi:hypothetical protein
MVLAVHSKTRIAYISMKIVKSLKKNDVDRSSTNYKRSQCKHG